MSHSTALCQCTYIKRVSLPHLFKEVITESGTERWLEALDIDILANGVCERCDRCLKGLAFHSDGGRQRTLIFTSLAGVKAKCIHLS